MWLVKRTGHSFLSLPHNIGTMYIQYFIQTLSEMSRKKLHISKSLIESYQNLNMSEVDKADSFNLCLSYLYWCFLIRIWLETVSQEKALKNLREMKKKGRRKLASVVAAHSAITNFLFKTHYLFTIMNHQRISTF